MSQARKGEGTQLPSRRDRVALATAAYLPIFLFLAAVIAAVLLIPGEMVQVGRRRGPYILVPALPVQIGVLAGAVPLASVVLARMVRGAYSLWTTRHAEPGGFVLAPGELIAWRGKQGLRGIDRTRLVMALLTCIGPALYVWWLVHVWTGAEPLVLKLFWSFFATVALSATVAPLMSKPGRTFVNDVLGEMVVTDRRIAWCSGRGNQYREILGAEIRDAALVEGDGQRGWIVLTHVRRAQVSEVDLFGVPDPAEALVAIRRFVSST
ncbi:hypothetical protein ASE95_16540 [Sphingomonas sp. Leaf231]|uniref:hypothetical protein n=1 Tax=unclassified Sphingomonas TaxID=196159 RepID=UPI0006FBBA12|nr:MULTISPECIES: hypothetical protein [unclassified Sphingomonas]KQN89789.1 hypothetical protein ASE95_16540 [Sphingomonas sp. Leaf231]KQR83470.1 hypothetical protein ASG07_07005 [Sphingomonas sp. Leaf343]